MPYLSEMKVEITIKLYLRNRKSLIMLVHGCHINKSIIVKSVTAGIAMFIHGEHGA